MTEEEENKQQDGKVVMADDGVEEENNGRELELGWWTVAASCVLARWPAGSAC